MLLATRFAIRRRLAAALLLAALLPAPLAATDYSSDSFILRDPVVTVGGTRSTSGSFEYFGSTGQTTAGQDSSSTFIQRAGFLYFPVVTAPVVTATAGDASASLTWTAASAELGYTVSAYEVGQSTVSGSGYGYTNVGNVLSSTRSSLTNGTTYYFVVRALDSLGDAVATSTEVSATPAASSGGGQSGGSSSVGGGGGPLPAPVTRVVLSGFAYPRSPVSVLRDGLLVATVIAAPDATFSTTLTGLSAGTYQFGISSEDRDGRRSGLVTVPVTVKAGATTRVEGLYLPPTIAVDQEQVRQGDLLTIAGQSAPHHEVVIVGTRQGAESFLASVTAGTDGRYAYRLDTARLERGTYLVRSKASTNGVTSAFNGGVAFGVGDTTVVAPPPQRCDLPADFNRDCRVNLVDFSILVYWYGKPQPPAHVELSGDGRINLIDFSILMYYWTG